MMKSFSILLCSVLLSGADAFQLSRRPSTVAFPAVALTVNHQNSFDTHTTWPSRTSLHSSISPDQEDDMFAPTQESQLSWVDLPTSPKRVRDESDKFEIIAGRVAMVMSLGFIFNEIFAGKSVPEQVLCALHIID
mmetsp:Transcript_29261/g.59335  ORF Transcript_29261/g.59335 Transcript_29261/m.59335 type:complete len:135 (-) Transcript_29261:396-800(-)